MPTPLKERNSLDPVVLLINEENNDWHQLSSGIHMNGKAVTLCFPGTVIEKNPGCVNGWMVVPYVAESIAEKASD